MHIPYLSWETDKHIPETLLIFTSVELMHYILECQLFLKQFSYSLFLFYSCRVWYNTLRVPFVFRISIHVVFSFGSSFREKNNSQVMKERESWH